MATDKASFYEWPYGDLILNGVRGVMMDGKRTVEQIKQDVATGKWVSVTPERDAREIIEALAAIEGPRSPEIAALIWRAKRHVERDQSLDVGSGDVNTDFGDGR